MIRVKIDGKEFDIAELFRCDSGPRWGMGTYKTGDPDPEWAESYGYAAPGLSPHDWEPDREVCTPEEIARWEAALATAPPPPGTRKGE